MHRTPAEPAESVPSPTLSPAELAAWLRLVAAPGFGPVAVRRLLRAFGSPEAVGAASPSARRAVLGGRLAAREGHAFALPPTAEVDALCERTLAWLHAAPRGVHRAVVPLGDPRYPAPLLQITDPPLLLHLEGQVARLGAAGVAIVGWRRATPPGLATARELAAGLAAAGLAVVSGLARGIDAAAHAGALDHAAGTIAVVGTGLDLVYPRAHAALAERVRHGGLLVSEHALGTPPLPDHFPRRNRLIAGLSRATVVVEAALRSGSLITARLALESGRDVLAVPGSIHSPQSCGCHALLKQGAGLVEGPQDVLDALGWVPVAPPTAPPLPPSAGPPSFPCAGPPSFPFAGSSSLPSAGTSSFPSPDASSFPSAAPPCRPLAAPRAASPLLDALGFAPVGLDALLASTGWDAPALNAGLLELELAGQVARLPGQRFQRLRPT